MTAPEPGADSGPQTASETAERADHAFTAAEVGDMRTAEAASDDVVTAAQLRDIVLGPAGPVQDPGNAPQWMLQSAAAAALHVSLDTIARRRKLGKQAPRKLESRKDADGRWWVLVQPPPTTAPDSPESVTELATLRERVARLESERVQLLADRRQWVLQADEWRGRPTAATCWRSSSPSASRDSMTPRTTSTVPPTLPR
jgi:hypothetical protein